MPRHLNDVTPLHWRALEREDLTSLDALLTAIEHLDDPATRHHPDELIERFSYVGADLERHAVAGFFGDSLLAYAWNVLPADDSAQVLLTGGIHPGWRSKRIGRELLDWQFERARRWYRTERAGGEDALTVFAYVDEGLAAQRDLYERAGMLASRWYCDMHRPFTEPLPEATPPAGISLRPYAAQFADEARVVHNVAFDQVWGSRPVGEVAWLESLSRSAARPEWSWLAVDAAGRVVGYALNSAHPQDWSAQGFSEGWTDRLGVHPEHRGRGIAKALLAASMRSFREAGLAGAGLGVDSGNAFGAVGLSRALGYVSADTVLRYQLVLEERAGAKTKKKG